LEHKKLDALDKGIIKLLAQDGRMSFTEIAEKLNVTEKTIRNRYKSLMDCKILKVTGVVNPLSLGLKVEAIILIGAEAQHLDQVREALVELPEVRYVTLISGEYQLLIQVFMRTYEQLDGFIKKLNQIKGLNKMNVIIQFEVYKNTFEYL
jgi:Lrp/AsnC family transcriptional regulator for asnA, asnC and gidA